MKAMEIVFDPAVCQEGDILRVLAPGGAALAGQTPGHLTLLSPEEGGPPRVLELRWREGAFRIGEEEGE